MSALASSNPVGFLVNGSLAYNQKIWDNSSDQFWQYGYIRPIASAETSVFVNSGSLELQLYPISMFGISGGTHYSKRNVKDLETFDCDIVNCKGSLSKNYYRFDLGLGFGNIISKLVYQKDFYKTYETQKPLGEFTSVLLLPVGTSEMERKVGFLGYKISDVWNVGYLGLRYSVGSDKAQADYAITNYKQGDITWTAGLGAFQSEYKRSNIAALVKVSWLFDPTLVLGE